MLPFCTFDSLRQSAGEKDAHHCIAVVVYILLERWPHQATIITFCRPKNLTRRIFHRYFRLVTRLHQPHLQPRATPLSLIARQTMQQKSSWFITGKPKQKKSRNILNHCGRQTLCQARPSHNQETLGQEIWDSYGTTRKLTESGSMTT